MAKKRVSLSERRKGLGIDIFFTPTDDISNNSDKDKNKINDISNDDVENINNSIVNDIVEDKISDKDINVNNDSDNDTNNDIVDDNYVDKNDDIINDRNSDSYDEIFSNINNIIQKRVKYTDIHDRKTYYIEKELVKKIDKLSSKNNLDKSYIVNQALKLFFSLIEKQKS
jgi:hypothetical protein